MPSIVVTSPPSAWTVRTVQLFTASPSRCTVHAPQLEVSQPTCVPVRPSESRRKWTSSWRGSTSPAWSWPFTVTVIGTRSAMCISSPSGTSLSPRNLFRAGSVRHPDSHGQAAGRPERRRLADAQPEAVRHLDAKPPGDRRGDGPDLELAEAHAEADPGAPAERDVRALRDASALLGGEALGPELAGRLPDAGQPVRGPGGVVHGRARRHGVPGEL